MSEVPILVSPLLLAAGFGAGMARADGDVWAGGITVTAVGGNQYEVSVSYGASWSSTQGEFTYTLLLTHKRNDQVPGTPINLGETIHPADVCDAVCGGSCGTGKCHYTIGKDPTLYEGSCGWLKKLCPEEGEAKHTLDGCSCNRSDGGAASSSLLTLIAGNTLTFSVTPSPGFDETNLDNNVPTVTIQ
ncbi:MAG: hypothetical protein Q9Q13_08315 [Acidobacteriota bacterium]|nr:hypothetical protein [Acidobacteriota bacterium]